MDGGALPAHHRSMRITRPSIAMRPLAIVCVATALALPVAGSATTLATMSPIPGSSSGPPMRATAVSSLDVGPAPLREVARQEVRSRQDALPADPRANDGARSKGSRDAPFAAILPRCNTLLHAAEALAVVAACVKVDCGVVDAPKPIGALRPLTTASAPADCQPASFKLW